VAVGLIVVSLDKANYGPKFKSQSEHYLDPKLNLEPVNVEANHEPVPKNRGDSLNFT
jgi:hypothetical protein